MNHKSYKGMLLVKRQELGGGVSRDDIAVERLSDAVDDVQHSAIREIAIANLNRHWETVREIDAAIVRLAEGTFGTCLECDDEIGEKRLRALPWAALCIHCQEAHDEEMAPQKWLGNAA